MYLYYTVFWIRYSARHGPTLSSDSSCVMPSLPLKLYVLSSSPYILMHLTWARYTRLKNFLSVFLSLICYRAALLILFIFSSRISRSVINAVFRVLARAYVLEPSMLFSSIPLIITLFSTERVFRSRIWCSCVLHSSLVT